MHLRPRVVAIGGGYHGCHGVLQIHQKLTSCVIVDLNDESSWESDGDGDGTNGQGPVNGKRKAAYKLGKGDLIHIETPLNLSLIHI